MKRGILESFEEIADRYPDKTAIVDENESITFGELKKRARLLAANINAVLPGVVNRPFAVYVEKSVKCITAFLGVLYSGNFYTPIDIKMPKERIDTIFNVLEPIGIICNTSRLDIRTSGIKYFYMEEILTSSAEYEKNLRYNQICDIDPMYVLFTSGSTGIPKGVVISHCAVMDYVVWLKKTFSFDENTVFGNQAPFFFDNSILDIYSTLCLGASMVIIPETHFLFPEKLLNYLNEKEINTIFWVPSALAALANDEAIGRIKVPSLQKVLFCGEVMHNRYLNVWRKHYPQVYYANLYGPTEITDVCSYYVVDRSFADDEPLPIGRACENTAIIVLNENNELVTGNEIGELCVRGIGVGLGYYRNQEKTKQAFVQNPLNNEYRDIIYRTGDLVRYNAYGELEYVCRKDFQIKHQGYRIELGEIETAAAAYEGVNQCCALYDQEEKKIILVAAGKETLSEKEIYRYMKEKLPRYMLPGVIRLVEAIPLTLNGKIDRKKLEGQWVAKAQERPSAKQ